MSLEFFELAMSAAANTATFECTVCRHEFELPADDTECPVCGATYNAFGQRLDDRPDEAFYDDRYAEAEWDDNYDDGMW